LKIGNVTGNNRIITNKMQVWQTVLQYSRLTDPVAWIYPIGWFKIT
jgi:hypothetical protein